MGHLVSTCGNKITRCVTFLSLASNVWSNGFLENLHYNYNNINDSHVPLFGTPDEIKR